MMDDLNKLIWSLFSVVTVRGEVANMAIAAIDATIPYVSDEHMIHALEKTQRILSEQLVLADDLLWKKLTHGRLVGTD